MKKKRKKKIHVCPTCGVPLKAKVNFFLDHEINVMHPDGTYDLGRSNDNVIAYLDMVTDDGYVNNEEVLLYLGGRIDDDALYPKSYCSYLNSKIKELNPTKIIAHTPWYAKKYYDKGILEESMKIDMVLVYNRHSALGTPMQVINPGEYSKEDSYKYLYDLSKDTTYLFYIHHAYQKNDINPAQAKSTLFNGKDFDIGKLKSLLYDRRYFDPREDDPNMPWDEKVDFINTTDGFAFIDMFLEVGFKNLNIIGFSAFGSGEDESKFSKYNYDREGDRYYGKTYFHLVTSENQRLESDILKYLCEKGDLFNLENYEKLILALEQIK
jgi:hypothetical protein